MQALGMIETRGYTTAWIAAEAMVKTAFVEVVKVDKSGAGYVMVLIEGDIESVRIAIEAGAAEAYTVGELVAQHIVFKPAEGLAAQLTAK